jgi:hypothetical protein
MTREIAVATVVGPCLAAFVVFAFRNGEAAKPRRDPPPPNDYT